MATYVLFVAAAILGLVVAEVFAGLTHWPHSLNLIPFVGLSCLLLCAFLRWSSASVLDLLQDRWFWRLLAAVPLGMFIVHNILSQLASPRSEGWSLAFELLWVGIVYGLIETVLLFALPAMAIQNAFGTLGWAIT